MLLLKIVSRLDAALVETEVVNMILENQSDSSYVTRKIACRLILPIARSLVARCPVPAARRFLRLLASHVLFGLFCETSRVSRWSFTVKPGTVEGAPGVIQAPGGPATAGHLLGISRGFSHYCQAVWDSLS